VGHQLYEGELIDMSTTASRYQQFIRKETDTLNRQQYTIAENMAKQQLQPNARGGYNWYQLSKKTDEVAKELFNQQPAAPAPAPAADDAAPAATEETTPTVEKTEASQTYTSDADKILAGIQDLIGGLPDYSAEMRQLREDMAISQRTLAANLSRTNQTPNLQIQPASGTPTTGGTQGFRRRQYQFMPGAAGAVLAGLNLGQPSMMNV
jgi:hypothetical protein